jgi:hypothetical protein
MDWYPLLMGNPFDLKEANGISLMTAVVLLVMTRVTVRRILGQFLDITKKAEEEFFASNQSKKFVNVTVHLIIEFSLNLSIHI